MASTERPFEPNTGRSVTNEHTQKGLSSSSRFITEYQSLRDDPFVEPHHKREALEDEVSVVVIGGGFGGMLAAVRLRQQGVHDIRIIDAAGDFGGTWYWNRYPGAQCDIESYCYFPLLEEMGYMPKERYSYGPEIFAYAQSIAQKFDLYDVACFQTSVTGQIWDEDSARWVISTDRGDTIRARFVINALGALNKPQLPGIPGIETFKGHTFHTCRWDYEYTGGGREGGLTKLSDKSVAVIGTGCTSIQCVPFLAQSAEQLYVFQRTPASVDVRGNAPTDPEWAATLEPGWQEARRRNFDDVSAGRPVEEILVQDGWTAQAQIIGEWMGHLDLTQLAESDWVELAELADLKQNEDIRARVDALVNEGDTRENLKAWYRQFCKRPTFNDEYLPTFNRPNVTLVDTSETKGVERITESALVANGQEYEVDCIIFATGFEVSTAYTRRGGFDIVGEGGRSLSEYWSDGPKTLHGITVPGMPNQFILGVGLQGPFGVNITAMLDDGAQHIAEVVKTGLDRGIRSLQPTEEAAAQWLAETALDFDPSNPEYQFHESCTPSYYNNEGDLLDPNIPGVYPHGVNAFNELLAEWRASGDLPGMKLELEKK